MPSVARRYTVRRNRKAVNNPEKYPWSVFDRSTNKINWLYEHKIEAKVAADGLNSMWTMYSVRIKHMMEEIG